jgi:hypothetical protein
LEGKYKYGEFLIHESWKTDRGKRITFCAMKIVSDMLTSSYFNFHKQWMLFIRNRPVKMRSNNSSTYMFFLYI